MPQGELAESEVSPRFVTGMENLPQSLHGVDPPAGLVIDSAGDLVLRRSLRDFFDFFISALGEESLTTIRARIRAYMAKSLPDRAFKQAEQILDGYLQYRLALQGAVQAGGKPIAQLDLAAIAQQRRQDRVLRARYLAPQVSSAFFDDDDRYDDYALGRVQTERDTSLSESEKTARIAELFGQLPPETQSRINAMRLAQSVEQVDADCKAHGCSPVELRSKRAAVVGDEAAVRLQALDEERAAWTQRVKTYLSQRAGILADASLSEANRQRELQVLQQRGFSEEERLRLPAFEQANDRFAGF